MHKTDILSLKIEDYNPKIFVCDNSLLYTIYKRSTFICIYIYYIIFRTMVYIIWTNNMYFQKYPWESIG